MPAKKKRAVVDLLGEEVDVRPGAHPVFHDLERLDALRKTEGNTSPDVLLLRSTLSAAHDRVEYLAGIVTHVFQALGDDRAKKVDDVPDAIDTVLGLLASFEESVAKLDGELDQVKAALKEAEQERDGHVMTIKALRVGHAEELRNRVVGGGGSDELKEAQRERDVFKQASQVKERALLAEQHAHQATRDSSVALLEQAKEAIDHADAEMKAAREVAEALRSDSKRLGAMQARVEELQVVEPLATAFAHLVSDLAVKLDVSEAAEDTVEAFKTALAILEPQ